MCEDFIKKLTERAGLCRVMGRGDVPVTLADFDRLLEAQARIAELEKALRRLALNHCDATVAFANAVLTDRGPLYQDATLAPEPQP